MPSFHIALHLIRRTMGSRRGLLMNVLLPALILAAIAGLFSGFQYEKAAILVRNADEGMLGKHLLTALEKENLYEIKLSSTHAEEELKAAVRDGDADAAIYIPNGYTQSLLDGATAQAAVYRMEEQLWNASLAAMLEAEAGKLAASVQLVKGAGGQQPDLAKLAALLEAQTEPKAVAEHVGMKLGDIISNPMMVGMILMFLMLLLNQTIGFVMEDRERSTMARMYTAPLRALDIAMGNFFGGLVVGTIQLIIVLSIVYYIFDYSQGISFGSLLLVFECFMLAALGLVSAVAGLVRNSTQLSLLNNLIIMPTCMISGCYFPISMLPDFLQKLANFTPQKWAIQAIDRLGGGGTIGDTGFQLLILLLFAAVTLAFGSAVLRPNRTR